MGRTFQRAPAESRAFEMKLGNISQPVRWREAVLVAEVDVDEYSRPDGAPSRVDRVDTGTAAAHPR
jgi:hypothetical protein